MDTPAKRIEREIEPPSPETSSPADIEAVGALSETERSELRNEVLAEIARQEKQSSQAPAAQPMPVSSAPDKSELRQNIEQVLEEDLRDAYFKMEPSLQVKFKSEGEQTAAKIEELFRRGKATAAKIFKLIMHWLKIIPAVNKFFLQQEAKIKTDRLMNIKK